MTENFWTKEENGVVVVGITEFALSMLGEITFVELPEVGVEVKISEEIGHIESLKAISPLISPINGKISEVNVNLDGDIDLINKDPLNSGWIWKMIK